MPLSPEVVERFRGSQAALTPVASCAGRTEEARATYRRYRELHPAARLSTIADWMTGTPELLDEIAAAFRIAGMPE